MKTPTIGLNGTAILAIAGLAVAAYVAYRVYRTGEAVTDAVGKTFKAATDAVGEGYESAKQTAIEIIDFLPQQFARAAADAPRMDELMFDEMGNVIGTKTSDATLDGYARPADTSSGARERDSTGTLSFSQPGASFKDLSDPLSINPFGRLYNFQQP